jgi:hypothetical protein
LPNAASGYEPRNLPQADPLTAFLDIHRRRLSATRGGKRFNAGEHAWLAGQGAALAVARARDEHGVRVDEALFTSIRRAHGREELHYGELVALSGDFYESPEALFDEKPAPLPWLWEGNDLSDLRAIFARELEWIEARAHGRGPVPYPDENIRLAWNAKAYVELALRNTDHFGWHNIRAYVRYHAEALRLAASARGRSDETFRRSLYTSAFADHFLTDAFAAGHIRVPRAEIRVWAEQQGLGEKIAGALSKLLHDQDGHLDLGQLHGVSDENQASGGGLPVQDSTGVRWSTRCDGQLFLYDGAGSKAVERAIEAVSASVVEVLLAWQRGELPRGIYAATTMAPFPQPGAIKLLEKFPGNLPDADLSRLWSGIEWYSKIPWIAGLEREHIRALFSALPEIMERFRANVATTADVDPELRARVAAGYLAAYRAVA